MIISSWETTHDAPSLYGASWHATWDGSSGLPCKDNTGTETASPLYGCGHESPDWISWGMSCHSNGRYDPAQTQTTRAIGAWLPPPLTPCHAPRREESSQHHAILSQHCLMHCHQNSSYRKLATSIRILEKHWGKVDLYITKQKFQYLTWKTKANFHNIFRSNSHVCMCAGTKHVHECIHLCCRYWHTIQNSSFVTITKIIKTISHVH